MLLGKFKISGHSMMPFLKPGDTILASTLPFVFTKPKVGDVIVFSYKDKILVKRIKKITGHRYFLSGDNVSDSLNIKDIARNEILGKLLYKL